MFKFFLSTLISFIDTVFMLFESIGIFAFSLILFIIVLIILGYFLLALFNLFIVYIVLFFIPLNLYQKHNHSYTNSIL